MILLNGLPEDRISVLDRGLQYGDGLFETMVYRANTIEFLDLHLSRLMLACKRLNIEFEQIQVLKSELDSVCKFLSDNNAVIKIIITRGSGGRGYLATTGIEPTRIISTHELPRYPTDNVNRGVKLRLCAHTLSENVALAGIKHLNRLDQVLARNEWHDPDIAEGLMQNSAGNIIEGTMSNVFTVKDGRIFTPMLDRAGVAGIIRAKVISLAIEQNLSIDECTMTYDDVLSADEVFITNSVIGLWPVNAISGKSFSVGPITQTIQTALQQAQK